MWSESSMIFLESNITKDPIEMYEPTHESHIACKMSRNEISICQVHKCSPFPKSFKGSSLLSFWTIWNLFSVSCLNGDIQDSNPLHPIVTIQLKTNKEIKFEIQEWVLEVSQGTLSFLGRSTGNSYHKPPEWKPMQDLSIGSASQWSELLCVDHKIKVG